MVNSSAPELSIKEFRVNLNQLEWDFCSAKAAQSCLGIDQNAKDIRGLQLRTWSASLIVIPVETFQLDSTSGQANECIQLF